MAVDQLRLQVLLQAVDKASGALKNVATGSKATAQAIRAAQDEARKLEKLQNDASGYQRTSVALRGHARDLAQAKSKAEQYGQQLQEQRIVHDIPAVGREQAAPDMYDDAVAESERIPGSTLPQDRRDERHEFAAEFENEGAVSVQFGQRRVVGDQGTQRASVVGLDDTGSAPVA